MRESRTGRAPPLDEDADVRAGEDRAPQPEAPAWGWCLLVVALLGGVVALGNAFTRVAVSLLALGWIALGWWPFTRPLQRPEGEVLSERYGREFE